MLTLVLTQRDTPHVRHVLRYGVLPSGKHGLLSHVAHYRTGAQLEERVSVLPFGERGSVSHVLGNESDAHRQAVYYTLDENSDLFEDE